MAAPATVPEFLEIVRRSSLVPEDRLESALQQIAAGPAPGTTEQMSQALVRTGALTRFQARQLKLGRYKRFEVAGKYRLLELLGAGGMGAVYLCEHKLMRRLVALKVLPQEKLTDPSNLERFYREARAVAALDHPNIVRAYDIDKYEQTHFLVMEFVDGRSLQEIVALYGKVDPIRVANYIAQAAVGLEHASELSMVHRDIKPGNLLLERTGVIKILDMGLARFFNDKTDQLTAKYDDNCVLGTADYLAPEQAMTNEVDIRADIYALGGTMYFCLTGQSPAPDGTVAQKLVFHQTREPKPVTEFRDDVPAELLAVLTKMMAKKPEDRYQTPFEVAEALAPWAEQVIAPPPASEMPDLCPAVLALAGHAGEKAKASATRTSAYARSGGGSSSSRYRPQPDSGGGIATGGPDTPRSSRTGTTGPASGGSGALGGMSPSGTGEFNPLSDAGRSGAVEFLKPEPSGDSLIQDTNAAVRPVGKAPFPWVLASVCAVLAVVLAGVVGYLVFFNTPGDAAKPNAGIGKPANLEANPNPELAKLLAGLGPNPDGKAVDATFTVVRIGENNSKDILYLNAKQNYKDADNLTVLIRTTTLAQWETDADTIRQKYTGKKIRVRGTIRVFQGQLQVEVTDPAMLELVP
jgi:eukaryotic-like serine/threonine-protein kinase